MSELKAYLDLLAYPIDMSPLLALPMDSMNELAMLSSSPQGILPVYHPTGIAQYALANWNAYLALGRDEHRELFMTQADWLLTHKLLLSNGACGWPISSPSNAQWTSQCCLSALTQGYAISVFLRAYQLTGKDEFMQVARQVVHTFELDILDGGVSSLIGDKGVFFEEVAIYPAAHVLSAHILALFGLYDFVAFTHNSKFEALIEYGVSTLHTMLDEFDTGYWTRYDLLSGGLASWSYHSLHIMLLEALARYSGCEHCVMIAARWAEYRRRPDCRLRYLVSSRTRTFYDNIVKPRLRHLIFRTIVDSEQALSGRICIPITAFPFAGGTRSVLAGLTQAMGGRWKFVYLTHFKGRAAEGLEIETFGPRVASPWRFPFVWLYCLTGWCKLFSMVRRSPGYDLILPQDGVFTGAFAALVGKIAGIRVVSMDHGNVMWLVNPSIRKEWVKALKTFRWPRQLFSRLGYVFYWPSFRLLARMAIRFTDQFLIDSDEVEAAYRKYFGVHPRRVVRYAYMLDVTRFTPPDKESRAKMRAEQGIPEEAIIITLVNRLVPEKGLHVAIEGIARALSTLPTDVGMRMRVLIAGDGPLRSQVQADIKQHGLDSVCILLGEASPTDVVTLLAITDIFLYSGTQGTNNSVALLEAMAAGCAVIASIIPQSNARLLADGRGIPIEPGSATSIGDALVRLCCDLALCRQMGQKAREYIAQYHNAQMLKRSLLRVSFFTPRIVMD